MRSYRTVLLCGFVFLLVFVVMPYADAQGSCAAVVQQESYNTTQGTHYFYGWSSGQATVEAAVTAARGYATQKRNGEPLKNDPSSSDVVVQSACGQPHGALAVQHKGAGDFSAETYWYVNGIVFGPSEEHAKTDAVAKCLARNSQTRIDCIVIGSW